MSLNTTALQLTPPNVREELFYQLGLRQFGCFPRIRFDPPPSLRDLVQIAVDFDEGIIAAEHDPKEVVDVSSLSP